MCLISVLPKGTKKNTEEVFNFIRSGASCNTDGSGFMYKLNNTNLVTIDKGYFNVDLMIEAIIKLNLKEDDELVIHHRIGTLGRVSAENTHPFIISKDASETTAVNITTDKPCMVHNGMFWGIRDYEKLNNDLSDTYAFARYIMPDTMNILENNPELFENLLGNVIGNDKLCFLRPNNDLLMVGKYIESNGYFHSNSGYCRQVINRGGVENENFTAAGTFSEGFNKPAVINKSNLKTNVKKLDNKLITINEKNYHHFKYLSKYIYEMVTDKNNIDDLTWELQGFDTKSNCQVLFKNNKSGIGSTHIGVNTDKLYTEYYYLPKNNNFEIVYKDLVDIVNAYPKYSKNGYKNIEKCLNNNFSKSDFDMVRFSKSGKRIFKLTLSLYKQYMDEAKLILDYNNKKNNTGEPVAEEVKEFLEVVTD